MNPQHWLDVERLFHEALALPAERRRQFVDESCAGNEALKQDVQSLLDESTNDDFLETPALDPDATYLQWPAQSSLVGRRLSEYEVTARIGAGGMGEVYQARDVKLGRDVAVKVLPPPMAHDTTRIARFKREAQILATLNHPHIAAIYALEESAGECSRCPLHQTAWGWNVDSFRTTEQALDISSSGVRHKTVAPVAWHAQRLRERR